MIVTMEFTLPDEAEDLRQAQNAPRYRNALSAVWNCVRAQLKHGTPTPTTRKALEEIRTLMLGELDGLGEEL